MLSKNQSFVEEVKLYSGQPIDLCFQCLKCAAGCTMGNCTDYTPNQILRLIQLGMKEKVLKSSMIWICTGCEICGTRCTNGIKMSEVMDTLKEMAVKENMVKEKKIHIFNDVFLNTIKSRGRIHEVSMLTIYKLKSGDLFSDIDVGMKMFLKGKLPLIPKNVRDKLHLKRIFKHSENPDNRESFVKCSSKS